MSAANWNGVIRHVATSDRNMVYNGIGRMRYAWDILNRMLVCAGATDGSTYSYRADGQRVEKVDGVNLSWTGNRESGHYDTNYATNRPSSRYFYDGQMGIEDDYNPSGTVTKVNRYALGARGMDRIEHYESSTTTYGYPLYDGHGNMRMTLGRSGTSYSTGNARTYDVWGGVRSGSGTGDPKQRYCANLGHVQDDESGLIYMRARYMDPGVGRFISEDPAMDGLNWFSYCGGDPVNYADPNGLDPEDSALLGVLTGFGFMLIDAFRQGDVLSGKAILKMLLGASAGYYADNARKLVSKAMTRWADKGVLQNFIRDVLSVGWGLGSYAAYLAGLELGAICFELLWQDAQDYVQYVVPINFPLDQ